MRAFRSFLALSLALLLANSPALQFAGPLAPVQKAWAVEVDLQFLKGFQFLDDNADPRAGYGLCFFDAGTENDRTVYQDAAGTSALSQPVRLDSAGRTTASVYIPTGSWKFKIIREAGVEDDCTDSGVLSEDDIEGALDTSSLGTGAGKPQTPVNAVATDTTITTSDLGEVYACDATGGNVRVTLPSAVTVGNGSSQSNWIIIQNVGSSGTCTATAVGGQSINGSTNYQLTSQFDQIFLISDGANWKGLTQDLADGSVTSAKLGSDIIGQFMQVGAVVAWPGTTCPTGYLSAYGQAVSRTTYEDLFTAYGTTYGSGDGSTTFNLPDIRGRVIAGEDDMGGSSANRLVDTAQPDGGSLDGDTLGDTGGAETHTMTSGELVTHTHGPGTFAAAAHTHGPGTYSTDTTGNHNHTYDKASGTTGVATGGTNVRDTGQSSTNTSTTGNHSHDVTSGVSASTGPNAVAGTSDSAGSSTAFNIVQPTIVFQWCVFASAEIAGGGSGSLHTVLSGSGAPGSGLGSDGDFYIDTDTWDVYGPKASGSWGSATSLIGPNATGYDYTFDSATADAEPGDGDIRFNNASPASATEIYIDDTDENAVDVSADILTWDDSTSTANRGTLRIVDKDNPANFAVFTISGSSTDATSYVKLTVTNVVDAGTIANDAALSLAFSRTGDKGTTGDPGATGAAGADPGLPYTWSTNTAASDPTSQHVKANNADLSSATTLYISDTDLHSEDHSATIASWDDPTNTVCRTTLIVSDTIDDQQTVFCVNGGSTDNTGWWTVSVSYQSGATSFTNDNQVSVQFALSGNDGAGTMGGSVGATDNAVVRADGTGGSTVQGSGLSIDDSDNLSGVNNVTGADANFATGTAGTNGNLAQWNADGDLVDGGASATNAPIDAIEFVIDGGGATITTGVKGYLEVPFGCTINRATALADQSGSIVVDVWKDTYANYPPIDADSITASAPVTISTATKSQDSTLTGWTTSVSAGDIIGFNVDSVTTVTRVTVSLKCTKT